MILQSLYNIFSLAMFCLKHLINDSLCKIFFKNNLEYIWFLLSEIVAVTLIAQVDESTWKVYK